MDNAAILIATAAVLSVWITIFIYLWRIDAAAHALHRELERERERAKLTTPTAEVQRVREQGETVEHR